MLITIISAIITYFIIKKIVKWVFDFTDKIDSPCDQCEDNVAPFGEIDF